MSDPTESDSPSTDIGAAVRGEAKAVEAAFAVEHGAAEVDMVLNVGLLRSGRLVDAEADIAAVRRALDAAGPPALLFVDGVSSIGSIKCEMDAWGVDVAVSGSQKGFNCFRFLITLHFIFSIFGFYFYPIVSYMNLLFNI